MVDCLRPQQDRDAAGIEENCARCVSALGIDLATSLRQGFETLGLADPPAGTQPP